MRQVSFLAPRTRLPCGGVWGGDGRPGGAGRQRRTKERRAPCRAPARGQAQFGQRRSQRGAVKLEFTPDWPVGCEFNFTAARWDRRALTCAPRGALSKRSFQRGIAGAEVSSSLTSCYACYHLGHARAERFPRRDGIPRGIRSRSTKRGAEVSSSLTFG